MNEDKSWGCERCERDLIAPPGLLFHVADTNVLEQDDAYSPSYGKYLRSKEEN
jgi:hypothetical protein